MISSGNLILFSNLLGSISGGFEYAIHSYAANARQAAELKVKDRNNRPGVVLLGSKSGSDALGYFIEVFSSFGTYLYKFDGSGINRTEINHDTTAFANDDVLRVEYESDTDTFTIKQNGTTVWTQSDSTYTSGSIGVGANVGSSTADDWFAYEDAGTAAGDEVLLSRRSVSMP